LKERICFQCGYEIDDNEPIFCDSCFDLIYRELLKTKKENESLKQQVNQLKLKVEKLSKGSKRNWRKGRR